MAEQNSEIIGNIIFSPINIEGFKEVSAYLLAPPAVLKDNQGIGIGTELINQGLETLKKRGAEIMLALGDLNYYTRTGFKAGHNLESPYKLEYPVKRGWLRNL